MMMSMDNLTIVLVLVTMCLVVAVYRVLKMHIQAQTDTQRQLQMLFEDSSVISECVSRIGTHLIEIEQQLQRVIEQQELNVTRDRDDREYEIASRMLSSGESIECIMTECGLARSEIDLLQRMQQSGMDQAANMK